LFSRDGSAASVLLPISNSNEMLSASGARARAIAPVNRPHRTVPKVIQPETWQSFLDTKPVSEVRPTSQEAIGFNPRPHINIWIYASTYK
jgi:hypothetical protein